jgi:hypothetical protein
MDAQLTCASRIFCLLRSLSDVLRAIIRCSRVLNRLLRFVQTHFGTRPDLQRSGAFA